MRQSLAYRNAEYALGHGSVALPYRHFACPGDGVSHHDKKVVEHAGGQNHGGEDEQHGQHLFRVAVLVVYSDIGVNASEKSISSFFSSLKNLFTILFTVASKSPSSGLHPSATFMNDL